MPLVVRGGKLIIGSDGKLTTNQDCCCDEVCEDLYSNDNYLLLCVTDPICCPAADFVEIPINVGPLDVSKSMPDFSCDLVYRHHDCTTHAVTVQYTNVLLEIRFFIDKWVLSITGDMTWGGTHGDTWEGQGILGGSWDPVCDAGTEQFPGSQQLQPGPWEELLPTVNVLDAACNAGFLWDDQSCTQGSGNGWLGSLNRLPAC